MEDLKEMFAQRMNFQMESHKKNEERILKNEEKLHQLQKENEERILKTRKNNNSSSLNYKNDKKHFFKSLSNNQPTDSSTIFTQNAVWNALETFSYVPDEEKTYEAIAEDTKISILPTVPIGLMQKSPATSTKARNRGT